MNRQTILSLVLLPLFTIFIWRLWYDMQSHTKRTHVEQLQPQLKTLIVGTNTEYPPFSFIDNDCIVGFDIDVAQEVSRRLGKEMVLKNMSFNALIPEIQLGSIHMIAAGITPTEERAKRVLFAEPHLAGYENPLVLVYRTDKPIDWHHLTGKTIAVNQGYAADFYISAQEGVDVLRLTSPLINEGLLALDSGHADAFIAARNAVTPLLSNANHSYQFVVIPETGEESALAISKKYPRLLIKVTDALNEMKKDGTLDELKKKWNLI